MRLTVYILSVWISAAVLALGIHLAISLASIHRLLISSIHASAPAMWLVPGVLLISKSTLLTSSIGLLLVATSAWLLVSNLAPRNIRSETPPQKTRQRVGFLRQSFVQSGSFSRQTLPIILGALTMQAGIFAIWPGYPLVSALLFGIGAGIWTASWITRDAYRPLKPAHPLFSLASLLLTFGLSASLLDRIEPQPSVVKESATQLVSPKKAIQLPGKELVPGVILRPEKKPRQEANLASSLPMLLRLSVARPLSFSFTGEYHLFPTSSGHVQSDSVVYRGTPLEAAYINMGGGSMETEAYQPFSLPIDCSNCGKMQLVLRSGDHSPSSATVKLLFAQGEEELGSQVFGFERVSEETLEYEVPETMRKPRLNGIRVIFHCDPARRSQSTRVAIDRFTFLPIG